VGPSVSFLAHHAARRSLFSGVFFVLFSGCGQALRGFFFSPVPGPEGMPPPLPFPPHVSWERSEEGVFPFSPSVAAGSRGLCRFPLLFFVNGLHAGNKREEKRPALFSSDGGRIITERC